MHREDVRGCEVRPNDTVHLFNVIGAVAKHLVGVNIRIEGDGEPVCADTDGVAMSIKLVQEVGVGGVHRVVDQCLAGSHEL